MARGSTRRRLEFGPLIVRLDRLWSEVLSWDWGTTGASESLLCLEYGPVGPGAVEVDPDGAPGLRIERLGPAVFRAEGPVSPMALRAAVRWVLVECLRPLGGFLLHAAAIEVEGRAHLFFGPPGAGKTTLAGNSGARAITEESAVVWPDSEGWRICGTPWWSDGGRPGRRETYPLARVGWLEQSGTDSFDARPVAEVLPRLAEQIYVNTDLPLLSLGTSMLSLLGAIEHGRLRFTRGGVYAG